MAKKVAVVGGGIAGLSCAYFLNKAGADVTVIDRGNLDDSSSTGNAGFLSLFEKAPMAYPGVFLDTTRAFLRGKSPMTVHSFTDLDLYRWGWHFYQASRLKRYNRTCAVLEHFGEEVYDFYDHLTKVDKIDCEYHRDGFALVCTAKETYQKKLKAIPEGSPYFEIIDKDRAQELVPFVKPDAVEGIILLKRNGHLNPGKVISGLRSFLEERGVQFALNKTVTDLNLNGSQVASVAAGSEKFEADQFIMASGAEIGFAKKLKQNLVLTEGRGYSVSFQMEEALKPTLPALFCDIYTAITPRRDDVRITGRIEFGGGEAEPEKRIDGLVRVLKNFTVDFELKEKKLWTGVRPLTSDEMPYIGRDENCSNFLYAVGLGHMGMSLGPIIGNILSDLIVNDRQNVDNTKLLLLSGFYQS